MNIPCGIDSLSLKTRLKNQIQNTFISLFFVESCKFSKNEEKNCASTVKMLHAINKIKA